MYFGPPNKPTLRKTSERTKKDHHVNYAPKIRPFPLKFVTFNSLDTFASNFYYLQKCRSN